MFNYVLEIEYCPWNLGEQRYKKFATIKKWGNSLKQLWIEFLKDEDLDLETPISSLVKNRLEEWRVKAFCMERELDLDED